MSGFGAFGGFGQPNNTQQSTSGFGGFGSNTGFGSTPNNGFGATNNANTGTSGLFGSGTSGNTFGATTTNAFGAPKPTGFGTAPSTGSGLFGSNNATATSAFGSGSGFGSANPSTFGATNTSGGLFGAPSTSSPFGGTTTTNAFGAPATSGISQSAVGECQGTGNVSFQAFVEKEPNSTTNQQNAFQNIAFQLPYQKFSPDELRLADYNQGRRFGNGSNQAGAFGQSSFGGFGSNTAGFGATNNATGSSIFGGGATSTPFGASQPAATGFGANTTATGSGIFGAKPATTGLFGSQPASQQSGGLFANPTNNAFGSTTTGGNMFAQNAAAKSPFSFANPQQASTGSAFGAPAQTSGFGGGGVFGTNNQQPAAASGFGALQPAQTNNAFGGFGASNTQPATSSVFGNTQNKPATGIFGAPAASIGTPSPFGVLATNNTNAFGTNNAQNNTGLFGTKPATGTENAFGSTNNATNSGASPFGGFSNQNQPQQQLGGGLFGSNNNNNNQAKPSIFGTSTQTSSSGLFGSSAVPQQNSLFGASTSNQPQLQQPQNSLFGSSSFLQNNSTPNTNVPQSLTASIGDNAAFGSQSLFSNIASTQVNNPGPIATPLSASRNSSGTKGAALPLYKLNSTSASRFSTPQKRGFGFSYSAYGSPSSATSTASTPGTFSSSTLLGAGSFSRTLNKSVSTSSLRRSFNAEDSILSPGAFSASPSTRHFGSTGNVKKLTISRNMRSDLFSPPTPQSQNAVSVNSAGILKKRVSFDANVNGNNIGASSPLRQVNVATPSSADLGYMRPRPSSNVTQTTGNTSVPEMEQVTSSNNQLAIVREEEVIEPGGSVLPESIEDAQPGEYWMSPTKVEIENMNRIQRQKVSGLTVGRHGVGSVRFDCPVDLTSINIADIMDGIVKIDVRQVTVYPDNYQKPPMGKGLNVPSTITLENSWPRKKDRKTPLTDQSGVRLQKHIEKLKKVEDTEFISYQKATGTWTFRVPHFTTYGCPDEDDDEEAEELTSKKSTPVEDTLLYLKQTSSPGNSEQSFRSTSSISMSESGPEDTFGFRKSSKFVPGAFYDHECFENPMAEDYGEVEKEHFSDNCSVGSRSENGIDEPLEPHGSFNDVKSVSIVDQEMTGSYPESGDNIEHMDSQLDEDNMDTITDSSRAIDKQRPGQGFNIFGTPIKQQFVPSDDWTAALQTTISPRKQDRALLKSLTEIDDDVSEPDDKSESSPTPNLDELDAPGFATSIDLMNSIFGQTDVFMKSIKASGKGRGFEWPYEKKNKVSDYDISNMDEKERLFHNSMKPGWGPDGTLVYAAPSPEKPLGRSSKGTREKNSLLAVQERVIVSEHRDIRFAKFSNEASADSLKNHKKITKIDVTGDVPIALPSENIIFSDFIDDSTGRDHATIHEKLVWELASILWDPFDIPDELQGVPHIMSRLRKNKLSSFWEKLVNDAVTKQVALARSHEEKAIAYLSGHRIDDACSSLITAGNLRLSTLVSLIGSKDSIREEMGEQLNAWRKSKMLSEFTEPIRAFYEMLAGNVCVCDGLKGPLEDRVESFSISKRFGLDWRQAFGLRLWYGTPTGESIEAAIERFANDLALEKETSWPSPWYIEYKVPTLWQDPNAADRVDLLWGLMKLYTFEDANLEDILRPENSQLSPMDVRLSWQLSQAIISSGPVQFIDDYKNKADQTTLSFSSQLTREGSWLDAVFVLLHLSSSEARVKAIQDHLGRHAGLIGTEDSQSFITLTEAFKIPVSWIWEAKALFLRSVEKDPKGEVECLIKAGSFSEAHRTFSREVAPKAIIALDYDTLRKLLDGFAGKDAVIGDWFLGGQIYKDFLKLTRCIEDDEIVDDLVLGRLLCGLPSVNNETRSPNFMERVAVETMSAIVANAVFTLATRGVKKYLPKVLSLPLTEDMYLKYSVELGLENFRRVMTRAR